jgi:hypothetical protein
MYVYGTELRVGLHYLIQLSIATEFGVRYGKNNAPSQNEIKLNFKYSYRGADKSLARPTSRCIFFDGENISFGASLVIYKIVLIFLQL